MSSFSANRQGRPRPSNISFRRRRSDDKSMPSPSFNNSMSLRHVEDVFCDSSRSVDRFRHHYPAIPTTPSSLSGNSSPGERTDRLPSLTDQFHRDFLSPMSSGLLPFSPFKSDQGGKSMWHSGSVSSSFSGRSRNWNASFSCEAIPGSIDPRNTPLSPYFSITSKPPLVSPTEASSDRTCNTFLGCSDGERTPRAGSRSSFDFTVHSSSATSSPVCPGAPLIGMQIRGHFETQVWQQKHVPVSLGSFDNLDRCSSYYAGAAAQLTAETLAIERAAMFKLEANLPKTAGMNGLGTYMDEENVQFPFRKAIPVATGCPEFQDKSPSRSRAVNSGHTGLTPMVKASKLTDVSSTPTRSKTKKSPSSLKTLTPDISSSSHAKTSTFETVTKKRAETAKTPLSKSRPMFRLDTGPRKKSSRPKGHNMSPNASPWGVFGATDGWKPLAPPNVSRAIVETNKLVSDSAATAPSMQRPTVRTSPASKRQTHNNSEAANPSKRFRTTESHVQSSPYKENMVPSLQTMSPSKRAQPISISYQNSPTAFPLSTIR